jgi:hypothetical protein
MQKSFKTQFHFIPIAATKKLPEKTKVATNTPQKNAKFKETLYGIAKEYEIS